MNKTENQENRNAADILKDFFRIREEIKALQDEIDARFDYGICLSLYSVDGAVSEAIGELIHAEFKAGRVTFTASTGSATETAEVANV